MLQAQLDFTDIERVFGIENKAVKLNLSASKLPTSPKVINLLDSKKSYNIVIMLSRVKYSFNELRQAILAMQDDVLTESFVKQLMAYIPTKEE